MSLGFYTGGTKGGVGLPWDQPVKVAGNIGRGCKLEVDYTIEGNDRAGVHATILIDISGSMHGERLQIVSAALRKLIKTCFAGDDLLTIWTFKGTIYPLIKCKPKRDVGLGRLFSDMRNHCKPSGHPECQTCLYDCISRAHTELCKHAQHHSGYQRFFIVFTDGEDTASSSTARQAWMQLQASPVPCLRTIFITAGLSKTSEVFDAVPSGGKIFRAETDAGSIEEQFERSAQYILGVLKVTMTDRRTGKEQFTYSAEASSQQELARKMNKGSCDVMAHFRRLTT